MNALIYRCKQTYYCLVIQRCESYTCCDWWLSVIWCHGKLVLFVLFNMVPGFENVLWDNFGLSKWKPRKKLSRNYSNTKKKNGETETKRVLTTWEPLNCKKSSQQLLSCVIATTDSLLCKMFSSLFCIEQVKTIKNFSKKLYTSKMKKRRSRDEK